MIKRFKEGVLNKLSSLTFEEYILLIKNPKFIEFVEKYNVEEHPHWEQMLLNTVSVILYADKKDEAVLDLLQLLLELEHQLERKKRASERLENFMQQSIECGYMTEQEVEEFKEWNAKFKENMLQKNLNKNWKEN